MGFDIVDAYAAVEDLNLKFNWLYEQLVEKGVIEAAEKKEEEEEKPKKKTKGKVPSYPQV